MGQLSAMQVASFKKMAPRRHPESVGVNTTSPCTRKRTVMSHNLCAIRTYDRIALITQKVHALLTITYGP